MAINVNAAQVKELRERTGAGMMDCKRALVEANGEMQRAIELLREWGIAKASKKAGRQAKEGLISAYIHPGGRLGVLIEVNCETDFVANTKEFQEFVKDLAMQVAAAAPQYVSRDQVPPAVLEHEREVLMAQARNEGRPENILQRIVEGRLEKFYEENCLLDQPFVKENDKKVQQLVQEAVSKFGENIVVRRFARFQLGEGEEEA